MDDHLYVLDAAAEGLRTSRSATASLNSGRFRAFLRFPYKLEKIHIDQVFVRLAHTIRQPRIDLQDGVLDEFGREDGRVSHWHNLMTITLQDQGQDVELLEVLREIGLRTSLDAQVGGGKAGHAGLEPEGFGNTRWFERLMAELDFELWIGDPVRIRAQRVRKQKTDRQDAHLLLKLLLEDRFPRVWVQAQKIETYGNCFGIGIDWCRCAHGS